MVLDSKDRVLKYAIIPNLKKHADGPGNEASGVSILRKVPFRSLHLQDGNDNTMCIGLVLIILRVS